MTTMPLLLLLLLLVVVFFLGLLVGFLAASRTAHRLVARLHPEQRLEFARRVSAASTPTRPSSPRH